MNFSDHQLQGLMRHAMDAARAAGRIIADHRRSGIQVDQKERGASVASQVVIEVDHKAQAAILEVLEPTLIEHDLALLTEESPDDEQRLVKPAFWCIDPMDGTLAFINDTPGYAVSIALVAQNGSPLIGAIYDPVDNCLFHAIRNRGAYKDDALIEIPPLDPEQPLVLRTDSSFQDHPWVEQTRKGLDCIAQELGLNGADIQFPVGAVMNACGILESPNTCYFKYPRTGNSGGSLWDYAASACLFSEAGGVASDIQGNPMDLNRPDSTFMNHRGLLFAGHQVLAERIITLNRALADTDKQGGGSTVST
ncbi:3'(2'),5'-bisphosphate nucleotidase CysQ family protein [Solemya velesiana gill symbiont]|uniref:Inositol monophosphatase n=1 Tax=Solemya velesiana gill symbiont TaxID=1918948 RepID=A0A1T2KW44_9GAMM|nr:inositol monophosphatase family protein [Solemya velesiana gill symbiont]OOZ37044.1 inositol monophosphatase [Solemya velesiana gill symbiont]